MTEFFNQNEKTNNILFISFYAFALAIIFLFTETAAALIIFIIFRYFGAAIYGFISKNPLKSYLFGFLLHPVVEIVDTAQASVFHSAPFFSTLLSMLPLMLFYSVIWGVSGYFAAKRSSDKFLQVIYVLIVFVFIIIQIALTIRRF